MNLEVELFKKRGESPVKEYVDGLPCKARSRFGQTIDLLGDFGLGIGMPHVRRIVGHTGLWELRFSSDKNIYRFLFTVKGGKAYILHGFHKKTQKTPNKEIQIALKRMKEI